MTAHRLGLNPSKNELLIIPGDSSPGQDLAITLQNDLISPSATAHNLGETMDNHLGKPFCPHRLLRLTAAMGLFVLMPLFLCALTSLFDIICSSTLEAKPGENVTILIEENFSDHIFFETLAYISWFKHTVDLVPLLLGCKQVKRSGETQNCYFFNESERIRMSVHGKKTSLTITAVTVSDTGLYYCSFIKLSEIKFCKSVYLQVKEGNKTLTKDLNKAADCSFSNVFFMLTVVFGAVSMSLITILIFIILKYRKKLTGDNTEVYEESESLNLHLSNKKSKRKWLNDTMEYQYVIYSSVET